MSAEEMSLRARALRWEHSPRFPSATGRRCATASDAQRSPGNGPSAHADGGGPVCVLGFTSPLPLAMAGRSGAAGDSYPKDTANACWPVLIPALIPTISTGRPNQLEGRPNRDATIRRNTSLIRQHSPLQVEFSTPIKGFEPPQPIPPATPLRFSPRHGPPSPGKSLQ